MSGAPADPATKELLLYIGAIHEPDFSTEAMSTDLLLVKVLARAMRNDSHDAEADARKSLRLLDVLAATAATAAACSCDCAVLTSTIGVRKSNTILDHTLIAESSPGTVPKEDWVVLVSK